MSNMYIVNSYAKISNTKRKILFGLFLTCDIFVTVSITTGYWRRTTAINIYDCPRRNRRTCKRKNESETKGYNAIMGRELVRTLLNSCKMNSIPSETRENERTENARAPEKTRILVTFVRAFRSDNRRMWKHAVNRIFTILYERLGGRFDEEKRREPTWPFVYIL